MYNLTLLTSSNRDKYKNNYPNGIRFMIIT